MSAVSNFTMPPLRRFVPRITKREQRRRDEIYCIEMLPDGRYVPINRYYKGIGINPNAYRGLVWIDYAALAGFALVEPLTAARAKWVVGNAGARRYDMGGSAECWPSNAYYGGQCAPHFLGDDVTVDRLYLYNDGNHPDTSAACRRAYDARVDRLISLVADPAEFAAALDPLANLHLLEASAA